MRLLQCLSPDSEALWAEVQGCITLTSDLLIIDDTTLDKPCASQTALVSRHWSGKHHAVVQGMNLISVVWSDGDAALPCDYRVYFKATESQRYVLVEVYHRAIKQFTGIERAQFRLERSQRNHSGCLLPGSSQVRHPLNCVSPAKIEGRTRYAQNSQTAF